MKFSHNPVMLKECIKFLDIKSTGVYVDGTVGGAGHASQILTRLDKGTLVAIDRDKEAIEIAKKRLKKVGSQARFETVKGKYSNTASILKKTGIGKVNGILLDIGVSSYQLDNADRGFGYMTDAKPDMRMGADEPVDTAYDIINNAGIKELGRIIRDYGEERWWKRIARSIVKERQNGVIETTGQLVDIIFSAIPAKARRGNKHPAKRTFQALRIAVNGELDELENFLDNLDEIMLPNGRVVIISFHSLEDRIVKRKFRKYENPCTCPPDFPVCACGKKQKAKVITKKPVTPTESETEQNPRARSAKLRVLEWL